MDADSSSPGGSHAAAARALLAAESMGLLSTISVHRAGYPYGSLAPYALSASGAPLLLLSRLAAHTRNLVADGRACLFVGDHTAAADPLAGPRLSLLGLASPLPAEGQDDGRARYLGRWPQAEAYFRLGDFALWELAVEEARLIAGFGAMGWLPGTDLVTAASRTGS